MHIVIRHFLIHNQKLLMIAELFTPLHVNQIKYIIAKHIES